MAIIECPKCTNKISDSYTECPHCNGNAVKKDKKKIIVKNYKGNRNVSGKLFQANAVKMAEKGYTLISQSYQSGTWGCGAFLIAALLCFIIVGFLVFIYMLIVKPEGTLTVTYEYKEQIEKVEEKICPQCAESIKKAAKICKFCRYEFT